MEKSSASRRASGDNNTAAAVTDEDDGIVPPPSPAAAVEEADDDPMDGPLGSLVDAVIEDDDYYRTIYINFVCLFTLILVQIFANVDTLQYFAQVYGKRKN